MTIKEVFNQIEEVIKSSDGRNEFYKGIIKGLIFDDKTMDYLRYMVKERLKTFKTNPQFSFNSDGGYE